MLSGAPENDHAPKHFAQLNGSLGASGIAQQYWWVWPQMLGGLYMASGPFYILLMVIAMNMTMNHNPNAEDPAYCMAIGFPSAWTTKERWIHIQLNIWDWLLHFHDTNTQSLSQQPAIGQLQQIYKSPCLNQIISRWIGQHCLIPSNT